VILNPLIPISLLSNQYQEQHHQDQSWYIGCGQYEELVGHLLLPAVCLFDVRSIEKLYTVCQEKLYKKAKIVFAQKQQA
jgi:hypothetical protein